jgi:hypothetical protein
VEQIAKNVVSRETVREHLVSRETVHENVCRRPFEWRRPFLAREIKKAAQGPPLSNWKCLLRIKWRYSDFLSSAGFSAGSAGGAAGVGGTTVCDCV